MPLALALGTLVPTNLQAPQPLEAIPFRTWEEAASIGVHPVCNTSTGQVTYAARPSSHVPRTQAICFLQRPLQILGTSPWTQAVSSAAVFPFP
eukprot:220235-Pelagomonas_calceolata.AAC.2